MFSEHMYVIYVYLAHTVQFSTWEFKFDIIAKEDLYMKEISDSRSLGKIEHRLFLKIVIEMVVGIIFTKYLVYCLVYVTVQSTEIY